MILEVFLERKDPKHHEALMLARNFLMQLHPGIQENLKWGLPIYSIKKNIAYLDVQKGRPLVGINYAYEIPEMKELLHFGSRTRIGHFYLDSIDEDRMAKLLTVMEIAVSHDLNRN